LLNREQERGGFLVRRLLVELAVSVEERRHFADIGRRGMNNF